MKRRWLTPERVGLIGIIVLFLVVLEVIARLRIVGPSVVQAPTRVFPVLWKELVNGNAWPHVWRTTWEVLASFLIGCAIGVPLGALFSRWPWLGRMAEPYLVGLYAVPLVLCYPVTLVIFGIGAPSIIAIAAVMATIPIVLNVWIGLSEVPPVYRAVARSLQFSRWQTATKVLLPAASPMIFAGLKMGVIYAFIGAVAMEFLTADKGVGFLVSYYYDEFEAQLMYAYLTLILIMAAVMSWVLLVLERRLRMEME